MNSGLEAMVRIGTGLSERVAIETGLRQGGRFSTTGAELALQHLNECLRTLMNPAMRPVGSRVRGSLELDWQWGTAPGLGALPVG